MQKKNLFLITLLFGVQFTANAWGFWAHQRINRVAVFLLPAEMILFSESMTFTMNGGIPH